MNTCEDTQVGELISSQEKTIELMLNLKQILEEDITIQAEILKHHLMVGRSFQTRSSYEDFNEEDPTEISDDDIEDLLHDENLLETEIQLLKDMLSQMNDDYSALKFEKDLKPCEDDESLMKDGFQSSEESLINEASSQYHIRKEKASLKKKCDAKCQVLGRLCNKRGEVERTRILSVQEILDDNERLHQQVGRENHKLISLIKEMKTNKNLCFESFKASSTIPPVTTRQILIFLSQSCGEDDERQGRLLRIVPILVRKVELKSSVLEHQRQNKHYLATRIMDLQGMAEKVKCKGIHFDQRESDCGVSEHCSSLSPVARKTLEEDLDVLVNCEARTRSKVFLQV